MRLILKVWQYVFHDVKYDKCSSSICLMYILMSQCKTALSPVLMHWRYCSLALRHPYWNESQTPSNEMRHFPWIPPCDAASAVCFVMWRGPPRGSPHAIPCWESNKDTSYSLSIGQLINLARLQSTTRAREAHGNKNPLWFHFGKKSWV